MEKECNFCTLEGGVERNVMWENENFRLILDQFPLNFGHCLIVSRHHIDEITDLTDGDFLELKELIKRGKNVISNHPVEEMYQTIIENPVSERSNELCVEARNQEYRNPDGFNIGINSSKVAGRTIDHFHIQMIPRYEGDVENPKGGIRNVIPGKGDYTS